MAKKRNTTDTSKNEDRRLKGFRESIAKLSEEFPDMADRFKELLERLESVVPELIARKATDEEIDLEVWDLLAKHVRFNLSAIKDLPPELCDLRERYGAAALFVYAQVYYKILVVVSSAHISYADLALNQYYLQVVKRIKYLLSLDELKDFTGDFDPPEHILPSCDLATIGWEDGVGPPTEDFLASAQSFLNELDINNDDADALAFFTKWLHRTVEPIFKKIEEYKLKTKKYFDGLMLNLKRQNEQGNEEDQKNHQSNVPYEISLLEEIAGKLESWAEERKTGFESKIEEERVRFKKNQSRTMENSPLDTYCALPRLSTEFDFVVKSFQFEDNFAPATMLIEIQNDLHHCGTKMFLLTLESSRYFDSYDPGSDEYESWLFSIETVFASTIPDIAKRIRKIAEMTKKKKKAATNQTLLIKRKSENKTAVTKHKSKATKKGAKKKQKGSDTYQLIGALQKLHGIGTDKNRLESLASKELEQELGWNQPKVHREMKKLFGDKPMRQYKQCFMAKNKLTGFMKKLEDGSYDVDGITESDQE